MSRQAMEPTEFPYYPLDTGGSFPGEKRPELEAEHSPPSNDFR
jgi:hypothetical protein